MRCVVVEQSMGGPRAQLRSREAEALSPGDGELAIAVTYSSLNFKDGLALTGNPGVARSLPLVPGVDAVGTVINDTTGRFAAGDRVLINGAGLGERRDGGYAEVVIAPTASVIAVPAELTLFQAAAVGTAGFTAALSVCALADAHVDAAGPILVTGATGGVGSIAIALLAGRGYSVTASTGRVAEYGEYVRSLGATTVIDRAEFMATPRALESTRWAGVVDSLGGKTLAHALSQTRWGGVVAACGMAESTELPTTVMPFILRAVSLVGINSVDAPLALRERAWRVIADSLDLNLLAAMTHEVDLSEVADVGAALLANQRHGRTVIRVAE